MFESIGEEQTVVANLQPVGITLKMMPMLIIAVFLCLQNSRVISLEQ